MLKIIRAWPLFTLLHPMLAGDWDYANNADVIINFKVFQHVISYHTRKGR